MSLLRHRQRGWNWCLLLGMLWFAATGAHQLVLCIDASGTHAQLPGVLGHCEGHTHNAQSPSAHSCEEGCTDRVLDRPVLLSRQRIEAPAQPAPPPEVVTRDFWCSSPAATPPSAARHDSRSHPPDLTLLMLRSTLLRI